jgi:hypothetical protein
VASYRLHRPDQRPEHCRLHRPRWRCLRHRWVQHRPVARAPCTCPQRRWLIGTVKACVLTVARNILVATTIFAGASFSWMEWRSMQPAMQWTQEEPTPTLPVSPCRPWPELRRRTPSRSPSPSAWPPWWHCSTRGAPRTSCLRRQRTSRASPSSADPTSRPWWPTANGSPAPVSFATRCSTSSASPTRPISSSCHWSGTMSSSAHAGSVRWDRLCGT